MAFECENEQLRVFFFPYFVAGHMIPMVDVARLFASHGVDVTIIATTANAAIFQKAIDRDSKAGNRIRTHVLPFPSAQVGLPEGFENWNAAVSEEMCNAISLGIFLLREPIERLFREARLDCIVSDMFHPWTADIAAELGIPRLVFHGSGYFQACAARIVADMVTEGSENDAVSLPGLPHRIDMRRSQLALWRGKFATVFAQITEAEKKTYGAIMNSFSELEHDYEEHFQNKLGVKAWSIGPVSLCVNKDFSDKVERGNNNIIGHEKHHSYDTLIDWLNSKEHNSVLYVSFGSQTRFPTTQLVEIAHGLEASGHQFIWVVRKKENNEDNYNDEDKENNAFLNGFEARIEENKKGLIIREWAPQVLILEHPAIGGTVTHCGWNSILEIVTAGLPMITWPLFAEQFYNEKLLTDVVRIGVSVGVKRWSYSFWHIEKDVVVKREKIQKAVRFLMGCEEEALEMRKRVKKLSEAAKLSVESEGSSQSNLTALINELKCYHRHKSTTP